LDKYFGNRQVSEILAVVAEQSMREGKVADAAELLSLAGRYSDLLSVLNRQLSSLLVTDDVNERRFWKGAAEQFLNTYLSNGQTHVIQVLEKERNLSLGNTFQMLLNLMAFFDRCNENKWQVRTVFSNAIQIYSICNHPHTSMLTNSFRFLHRAHGNLSITSI